MAVISNTSSSSGIDVLSSPPVGQRVLILGCGLSCPPLITYLADHHYSLIVATRTADRVEKIGLTSQQRRMLEVLEYDVENDDDSMSTLHKIVEAAQSSATSPSNQIGVIVSMLPYLYHVAVAKVAISHQIHFITASYVSDGMQALNNSAVSVNILLLNELGVDPGLDHMSAQRFIDSQITQRKGKVVAFQSLCGGLPSPSADTNPLHYKLSWSARGVLLASRNSATFLDKGEVVTMSGTQLYEKGKGCHIQTVSLPQPILNNDKTTTSSLSLEWYPNRDSTSYSSIYRHMSSAHTLIRGTYRAEGWCSMMNILASRGFTNTEKDPSLKSTRSLAEFTLKILGPKCQCQNIKSEESIRSAVADYLKLPVNSDILNCLAYLGLFSPSPIIIPPTIPSTALDILCWRFEEKLQYGPGEQDMIVMQHTFDVELPSQQREEKNELVARWRREKWTCTLVDIGQQKLALSSEVTVNAITTTSGQSSMSRTVSLPVAIAVRALLSGHLIGHSTGVHRPLSPQIYNLILNEMSEQYNIRFIETLQPPEVWLRDEVKVGEARVILTPKDAAHLIQSGVRVVVERSNVRCISDSEYSAIGCNLVDSGSWIHEASVSTWILGLKELAVSPYSLFHRHIFFGHCYKSQNGASQLLDRFVKGRGMLFDLEFLVDENGKRVAAFGRAAGIVGAALGILQWCRQQTNQPCLTLLQPWQSCEQMLDECQQSLKLALDSFSSGTRLPKVHILGALGRCGSGASWVCQKLGLSTVEWDIKETSGGGPFTQLCDSDILINAIYLSASGTKSAAFLTSTDLQTSGRKLSVLVDVSCDPNNPNNPFPIYSKSTTLAEPIVRILTNSSDSNGLPLDVIAIDHLPSLLPLQSSQEFSAAIIPHIIDLVKATEVLPPQWQRVADLFRSHIEVQLKTSSSSVVVCGGTDNRNIKSPNPPSNTAQTNMSATAVSSDNKVSWQH